MNLKINKEYWFTKIGLYFFALIMFLGLVACKPSQNLVIPNHLPQDPILQTYFTKLHEKGMFNGAAAVKKDGKLIFKQGFGIGNMELKNHFTPQTEIEIASVSKQFTAAAVMILRQKGQLNIEDPAYKYLGLDFPYHEITVKHLLTHTSGLPDYEPHFRKTWNSTGIVNNEHILNYFIQDKPALMSAPGEKYHYSNSGYVLLASIVKAVSHQDLDVFLKEFVFTPAGMDHSGFFGRDEIWTLQNYAPGYLTDPATCAYVKPESLKGKAYYRFLSGRLGSGRLSSNIEDLLKWDEALYTNRILNEESKQLSFEPHPPSVDPSDYGFGWHIPVEDGGRVVYHTGSWAGNLTYIKRFLETKSVIVLLNNTHSAYVKKIRAALDAYVQNGTLPQVPQRDGTDVLTREICSLTAKDLSKWLGQNPDINWDRKALDKLADQYLESGDTEKADKVKKIIDILKI